MSAPELSPEDAQRQVDAASLEPIPFEPVAEESLLGPPPARQLVNGPGAAALPLGRTLPHSVEAEEYLLSCCLLDGSDTITHCLEARITPDAFYVPSNRMIYEIVIEQYNAKTPAERVSCPVDLAVVAETLKTRRLLESVGGYAYLTHVSSKVPTTVQAQFFIQKVRELHLLREYIKASTAAVEDAFNYSGDFPEFLAMQEARISPILRSYTSTAQGLTVWTPAQFRAWTPPLELNLLGAGYLRRRQITTLIGPPGVGKSRLSLWMGVCHIAGRSCAGLDPKGGKLRWLFVGNENDPERQKRDLDWFYRNLTKAEQAEVDDRLFLHVLDTHADSQMTLADPEAYARLSATLKAVKPDVFVCDPWGNMIETNENDNEEVRRTLKLLLRAVAAGSPDSAILIIHHARTGKSNTIEAGNNYSGGSLGRGSKVLVSQARCELALWPGDADDASRLVLTCEKVNNAPKFEPIGLTFENGIYNVDSTFSVKEWRDDIEGRRSGKTFTISDVVSYVRLGIVKAKDIFERADSEGISKSTVIRRLNEAVEKHYLEKSSPPGSYSLPPAAKAYQEKSDD